MRHIESIKKIVGIGDNENALNAIDHLLDLGPNNLEALKLKAMILASQGRFTEEAAVWNRISSIDREDEDMIDFVLHQQDEDREHFYFSDALPEGGRRYIAYPRAMFYSSFIGLIGCLSFFLLSKTIAEHPGPSTETYLLSAFSALVLIPWFAIIFVWIRSLRSVTLNPEGVTVETRFRKYQYLWAHLNKALLCYSSDPYDPKLSLVLQPSSSAAADLWIDLSDHGTSSIKGRSHFLRELETYAGKLTRLPESAVGTDKPRILRF